MSILSHIVGLETKVKTMAVMRLKVLKAVSVIEFLVEMPIFLQTKCQLMTKDTQN